MLPGKTLSPWEVLNMARRRAWLITIPPVITAFAALLYSATIPNIYQSDMLIAIDPQRVPDDFVRSTVTLGTDRRVEAISVKVLSRTNLEQMIEDMGLYQEERKRLAMEDVIGKMRDSITVQLERPRTQEAPQAFHVKFTHPDPTVAAQVTQRIGSLFVDQNARDRGSLAASTNSFLDTQLEVARRNLEAQERRLETFRQAHGKALPTQMQANIQSLQNTQMQIQSLVESIARDRDRKQMLERLYRDAVEDVREPPPLSAPPGVAPGLPGATGTARQQLASAKSSLASLELRYTSDHPDVTRAKRLVAELEAKVATEGPVPGDNAGDAVATSEDPQRRDRLAQMQAEIESLGRQTAFKESEERRLRAEISEYQTRIEAVPGLESDWIALTRDYDTQQAAYKDLLSKSGNAKVAAALEEQKIGEHFSIVDPAGVPVHPLRSLRPTINAAGLILGLLVGIGLAVALEVRDASFRTEAEVVEFLALPVLATLPYVETPVEQEQQRRRTRVFAMVAVSCLVGMGYVTWTMKLWKSLI